MSAAKRAPLVLRPAVLARDRSACLYCGGPWEEVEHLIPRIHGGPSVLWNLALSCIPCNRRKGIRADPAAIDHLIRNLRLMIAETRLYVTYQRDLRAIRDSRR